MTTIALIDDHLIVRSGFAQLLGLEADFQVVAEFGSGREALAGLPGRGVQVCICDISMPDISGLELLSQLPKGMAIVMLSVHDSPALVEQALNAGARGFLSKRCSPDELIAAVRTVAAGGCYLTPDIAMKLAAGRRDPLTKREREVAEKLAQGMAVKEIAAELGLSPKTVHVHRANLLEKLGVSNDVELARRMFDSWQCTLFSPGCSRLSAVALSFPQRGFACGASACTWWSAPTWRCCFSPLACVLA